MRTYCISTRRPECVKEIQEQIPDVCFVIRPSDEDAYKNAGAKFIRTTEGLVGARNLAIDDSRQFGDYCHQISDDVKKIKVNKYIDPEKADQEVSLAEATLYYKHIIMNEPIDLLGVAPTDNAFFAQDARVYNRFIIGDFFLCRNDTGLRFRTDMTLKEDYYFTLAHVRERLNIVRDHKYLFSYQHYTNKGGAVDVRTVEEEAKNISILKKAFPSWVKDNQKRPNEILLRNHLIDSHVNGQDSLF